MKAVACGLALAIALCAGQARAQAPAATPATPTADEVVEKYLNAIGGRPALGKLESRISRGTMTVSVQGVELAGPVEVYAKAPNKLRTYARFDLSQMGAGEVVVDQRCDGKSGFVSNTMQVDRDITGSQLQSLLNNAVFPTPLLNYKEAGGRVELTGKDTVGDRAAYVVVYTPKAGNPTTFYFDAASYLPLRMVAKVDIPELGGETEQVVDFSEYRDVHGITVAFAQTLVNSAQSISIHLASVEHNQAIDEAMFSKPTPK
jgi:outer membrane lipoprotein-sorting protein